MENYHHQRIGADSNSAVGNDFEALAKKTFGAVIPNLQNQIKVKIGIAKKKEHAFDFGNENIIVECKSHRWTESDGVPQAKLKNWNEAMYLFYLAPKKYKKFFVVEMSYSQKRTETLLEYYIRIYGHLIPKDVILVDLYTENYDKFSYLENNDAEFHCDNEIYCYDDKAKEFIHKPFIHLKEYLQNIF